MKSSTEFGKLCDAAGAGVVTSPESCKDHHSHAPLPARAGATSLKGVQRGEHAALDEKTHLHPEMEV